MGVSWEDAMRMPWGVTRMLFMSRAQAHEAAKAGSTGEEVRYATQADYDAWL